MKAHIFTIIVLLAAVGCSKKSSDEGINDTVSVEKELQSLSKRVNQDRFVIFEDPKLKKNFVQFAVSESDTFLLDVPSMHMDADELAKAKDFFEKLGVLDPYSTGPYHNHDTGEDFYFTGWQYDAGINPEKAANVAKDAAMQIYGFSLDASNVISN